MSTQPKPVVFVLMPFSKEFDDVWELGIAPACAKAGAYAERVDKQIFHDSIRQRVYTQIAKADLIVADMTGRNANVFYECGYAHALGKRVILLTEKAEDIPFDLNDFPHIVYEGRIVDLIPELEKRVRYFIANPSSPSQATTNTIEIQVNDVAIVNHPTVPVVVAAGSNELTLSIDIHNSAAHQLRVMRCQLGLVTPMQYRRARVGLETINTVVLNPATALHYVPRTIELLPGGWEKLSLSPAVSEGTVAMGAQVSLSVRAFTDIGYFDYPFTLETKRRERR